MTGKTAREHWLAGDLPQGRDETRQFAEWDACAPVSDADRAYARMELILSGSRAAVPELDASVAA